MQRKATKNTRGPNAEEKRFQAWLKEQPCCVTWKPGPSIVHHCEGATFRNNKILVGHWFCIPLCQAVDDIITHGSRRKFRELYGPQSKYWAGSLKDYLDETGKKFDIDIYNAIMAWGK